MFDGVHADVIHSSQPQAVRNAAVDKFRSGDTWLLIATDLVGRGMDFLGVHTVINYDFPQSTTDYIHRVGRTGRAGRTGSLSSPLCSLTKREAPSLSIKWACDAHSSWAGPSFMFRICFCCFTADRDSAAAASHAQSFEEDMSSACACWP